MSADEQAAEGADPETGEVTEPPQPEPEPETPIAEPEPEQPDNDPDQDEGAEPEAALTDEQIAKLEAKAEKDAAKVREKLDAEAERHRTRLAEILREDVLSLVPCELCRADLAGWVETETPLPEEVKQRVRIQIGDREPRKVKQDPHSKRCETCDGETIVETGAKDGPNITLPCVDCGGAGWIATDDKRQGFRSPTFTPPPPVVAQEEGNGQPVSHPALSTEDQAEIARLKSKGIVVIVPEPA